MAGPLGAQFLVWEYAVAVAGQMLGIDPFDQPNVAESKENTARLLAEAGPGPLPTGEPALTDRRGRRMRSLARCPAARRATAGVLDSLLMALPDRGYLAIMAYLDRDGGSRRTELRDALASRTTHPVTFGWGPRFLHSTGQYHKGGHQNGVFLQITGSTAPR